MPSRYELLPTQARTARRLRPVAWALAALVGAAALAVPAAGATRPRTSTATGMFGDRYCEYLVVTGTMPHLKGTVWNTYGLNRCPEKRWRATDVSRLRRELGALIVVANGPRFWLMDRAKIWNPGPVRSFDGLRMRKLTTFEVPLIHGVPQQLPYHRVTINRRNTFVWRAGRTVHELVAPNGRVYVMQAYSQIVDRHLRRSELAGLGRRLKLPAGWRYRNRRLARGLSLYTAGHATVIQDDLQDTYQLVPRHPSPAKRRGF